jgi:hypothetical protein
MMRKNQPSTLAHFGQRFGFRIVILSKENPQLEQSHSSCSASPMTFALRLCSSGESAKEGAGAMEFTHSS